MKEVYTKPELETETLQCDHCGWKGKGTEARIVDLYGIAKVQELHCPQCDTYLAGLSADSVKKD